MEVYYSDVMEEVRSWVLTPQIGMSFIEPFACSHGGGEEGRMEEGEEGRERYTVYDSSRRMTAWLLDWYLQCGHRLQQSI